MTQVYTQGPRHRRSPPGGLSRSAGSPPMRPLRSTPTIGPRTVGVRPSRAKDMGRPSPILAAETRVAANLEALRPELRAE